MCALSSTRGVGASAFTDRAGRPSGLAWALALGVLLLYLVVLAAPRCGRLMLVALVAG